MTNGIRDRVAIIGMGCTKFGERWESDAESLIVEAFSEAITDAGIDRDAIGAAWLGCAYEEISIGKSAIPLSVALRLPNIPVTRVENLCASATEALRGASYAVAAGVVDIALAVGVEKLKDTGYGGLPVRTRGSFHDQWLPPMSASGAFAQLAHAYSASHGIPMSELKRAIAHISVKSHKNGLRNPKAHLRREISLEQVLSAPMVADPLGLYDCCGVSDGAACAIVCTPEVAASLGVSDPVLVKSVQIAASNGSESGYSAWNGSNITTTRIAAERAYREAGITAPAEEIDLAEVHDCFSITELVTMEDLGFSKEGLAVADVLDGRYDSDGSLPCQVDGGLKCFGHPVGASGLRMIYEVYTQLLERAGERQLNSPRLGLTHNLGGAPSDNVASVTILGRR